MPIDGYKQLRIYKNYSLGWLLNAMMCNRIMKRPLFVANAPKLYKYSCNLLGVGVTNSIIQRTFCSLLTAGNSLSQNLKYMRWYRDISIIMDYSAEGEQASPNSKAHLDDNAQKIIDSANLLQRGKGQMIAVKITGLVQMSVLKKWNTLVQQRNDLWTTANKNGRIDGITLQHALNLSHNQMKEYLANHHNHSSTIQSFTTDEVGFKMNHHPWHLFNHSFHSSSFTQPQKQMLSLLKRRLLMILDHTTRNEYIVLVDAQQTYIQKAIQCIAQQMQQQYNKVTPQVMSTVQCYLKDSVQRSRFEVEIARRRNLKFGAKLVRGAYLVEETRIAKEQNKECKVVECFESTTKNYLQSFEIMYEGSNQGHLVVATHNIDTVTAVQSITSKHQTKVKVSFAQLVGLADHLTWQLKNDGSKVFKYLPWAETRVMIPYIIRRAEELSQMKYPLDMQYQLLKDEIRQRY